MYNYENLYRDMPKGKIAKTLTERITDELICGNLKPGDKLPTEVEFSKNLHVGRNAVRESMKVLEAFGIIEIRRAEGTFIASALNQRMINSLIYDIILSMMSETDLIEFETVFISSILLYIKDKINEKDIEELQELCSLILVESQKSAAEAESVYGCCRDLMKKLAGLSGNSCMEKFMEMIMRLTMPLIIRSVNNGRDTGNSGSALEIYTGIADALKGRDSSEIYEYTDRSLKLWRNTR